ncbi:MAG: hypothetical protein QHJ73_00640 [Armatimonadota bacterium]|nr:hypothetical protein [Armatimonadota bacterium]
MLSIPCGKATPTEAFGNGTPACLKARREFGQNWAEIALPAGAHSVELHWESKEREE